MSAPEGLVHGMADDLVEPRWPPLTGDEVREVLVRYVDYSATTFSPRITWRSPRPMSAAALVDVDDTTLFVKRHHASVRTTERLRTEHDFAQHLLDRGCSLPVVLRTLDGDSVLQCGEFIYEVHSRAPGADLYREVPSWYPYATPAHARAAGVALARFHRAAREYASPMTPPGVLTNTTTLVASLDTTVALERLLEARPGLVRALGQRDLRRDVDRFLRPGLERAAALLAACPTQWGHGDWHASNLTWSTAGPEAHVAAVIDLGLSNRTFAVHDLAIALERSCVDWLDVAGEGHVTAHLDAADQLLDGYEEVRRLEAHEWAALLAVLPVVHTEFALSEVEYFDQVAHEATNVDLAYDGYLIGHARWFESSLGKCMLDHLSQRANALTFPT